MTKKVQIKETKYTSQDFVKRIIELTKGGFEIDLGWTRMVTAGNYRVTYFKDIEEKAPQVEAKPVKELKPEVKAEDVEVKEPTETEEAKPKPKAKKGRKPKA